MADTSGIGVALIAGVAAILGAAVGGTYEAQWHNREIDGRMVGFAIDVLKSDCKSAPGLVPARKWAVDLLSHYAGDVPLDGEAKAALTENSVRPGSLLASDKGEILTTDKGEPIEAIPPTSGCAAEVKTR